MVLFASRDSHQLHADMTWRADRLSQVTQGFQQSLKISVFFILSPFPADRKNSSKNRGRGIKNDVSNSKLACTTLI